MSNDVDSLLDVERLLREAEAKLRPVATFRQTTLLQMLLFEVERSRPSRDGHDQGQPSIVPERDDQDR